MLCIEKSILSLRFVSFHFVPHTCRSSSTSVDAVLLIMKLEYVQVLEKKERNFKAKKH